MSDIFRELERSLPEDCLAAIESGEAEIVAKYGTFVILDKSEVSLFNCLPFVMTRFGFAISIPSRNGKVYNTGLAEVLCRKRGIVRFLNECRCDFRLCNLEVKEWENNRY